LNPPLFIALESSYAITDNELYHDFNIAIAIHLGNPGLVLLLLSYKKQSGFITERIIDTENEQESDRR